MTGAGDRPSRAVRRARWTRGNHVELLENGEVFFPRVFAAIAAAEREVILETFIWFDDRVGRALHAAVLAAARRGVRVDLMIDGFGSPDLSPDFIGALTAAGVRVRIFDPGRRVLGHRLNVFRRMHRKIVVVDGTIAFVGGINYSEDHLLDYGPMGKQDYAVALSGPIVPVIHRFVLHAIAIGDGGRRWLRRRPRPVAERAVPVTGDADVLFVTRDNWRHTDDIEAHYLAAIAAAKRRIVIANAYFFPGYRLIRALRRAARRGVDVRLVLQGEPDIQLVRTAASLLYHHLVRAGVRVYEYVERPLHGKVALTDDTWSTVGSSNLDPLSLSLNLEANVIVRDAAFNRELAGRLDRLIDDCSREIHAHDLVEWSWWRLVRSFFVFHFLRWYPTVGLWLPRHAPLLARAHGAAPPAPYGERDGATVTDAA